MPRGRRIALLLGLSLAAIAYWTALCVYAFTLRYCHAANCAGGAGARAAHADAVLAAGGTCFLLLAGAALAVTIRRRRR